MEAAEPGGGRVRPTAVQCLPPLAVLLVLTLAGCGSGGQSERPPEATGCAGEGRVVARADLDGDGRVEQVRLVTAGLCRDSLVAEVGGRLSRAPAGLATPAGAGVVHLRGDGPDLVLLRTPTSREGVLQPRLYGVGPAGLGEVTSDGDPVLPPLDDTRGAAPREATCASRGRLSVLTARASEPPGIVLAWDLTRTTYDVRGTDAVRTSRRVVRRSVADPVLRRERPGLYDGRLFPGCS